MSMRQVFEEVWRRENLRAPLIAIAIGMTLSLVTVAIDLISL